MIDMEHKLPITKQCKILELSRSSIYYEPAPVSDKDRELIRLIDEIHLEEPYLGSRRIKIILKRKGYKVGRTRVSPFIFLNPIPDIRYILTYSEDLK